MPATQSPSGLVIEDLVIGEGDLAESGHMSPCITPAG